MLLRLSEMSDQNKKEAADLYNKYFKKPTKEFDSNGLRYPVKYLGKLGGSICSLPLEYMAEFVDVVTKNYVDGHDEIFALQFCGIPFSASDFPSMNATALGNAAYVALHSHSLEAKNKAVSVLETYIRLYRQYE